VNLQETEDLLTIIASLDNHHAVTSKEKMSAKAFAWQKILADCEYSYAEQAAINHYRDPNAKSISAALLRTHARRAVPVLVPAPQDRGESAEAYQARERSCNAPGCSCPHTVCWGGWISTTHVTRFGVREAAKKCPECKEAQQSAFGGKS
jgi:hypothetical protein